VSTYCCFSESILGRVLFKSFEVGEKMEQRIDSMIQRTRSNNKVKEHCQKLEVDNLTVMKVNNENKIILL
jgi:hypothetical protein